MKYTPRFIIYWAVCRYLSEEEIESLRNNLAKGKLTQDNRFLSEIRKVFDFKRMLINPQIREDAWIYNHIEYEMSTRFHRKGLIAKYEKVVVLPCERTFKEFCKTMGIEKIN